VSFADLLRFAARALSGARLRSLLSLLGVSIGVAAVVILTALGEGARRYVVDQFSTLGTNLLAVVPGRTETTGVLPGVIGTPNDLTLDDARAVARRIAQARQVAPIAMSTDVVSHGELQRQVAVIGTNHQYLAVRDLELAYGSFLPLGELDRGTAVVVLGHAVARELFPVDQPVGSVVRVGEFRMRVIGVLAPTGTQLGIDLDELVMVPTATAMRMFDKHSLFRLLIKVGAHDDIESSREAVRQLLIERHGEEDFTVQTEEALASTFSSILGALTFALGGIAAVSLSVAGLGIMNVMLVAASERTSEIGLLRALGASQRQILAAFLIEAVMLSGSGGVLGLALGGLAVRLMVRIFPALPAAPPLWAVVSAFTVSLLVGAVFGLVPARRAARLDPVEALAKG